jgi:uracil-DNA glycosylase
MQSEMPKKYWKNLPEAQLISGLIADSRKRVQTMLEAEERPVKPAPNNAYLDSLRR